MTSRPHVDPPRRRADETETIRSKEKLEVLNAVSSVSRVFMIHAGAHEAEPLLLVQILSYCSCLLSVYSEYLFTSPLYM